MHPVTPTTPVNLPKSSKSKNWILINRRRAGKFALTWLPFAFMHQVAWMCMNWHTFLYFQVWVWHNSNFSAWDPTMCPLVKVEPRSSTVPSVTGPDEFNGPKMAWHSVRKPCYTKTLPRWRRDNFYSSFALLAYFPRGSFGKFPVFLHFPIEINFLKVCCLIIPQLHFGLRNISQRSAYSKRELLTALFTIPSFNLA